MTNEQIAYLNYQETKRANEAREALNEQYYALDSAKSDADVALKEQQVLESQQNVITKDAAGVKDVAQTEAIKLQAENALVEAGDFSALADRVRRVNEEEGWFAATGTALTGLLDMAGGLITKPLVDLFGKLTD